MPALFAITLFLSAALLFLIQPMVGKMLLPLFGGTPAVWNTCMVFFQAALLAGYGYAHAAPFRLDARRQAVVHLLLALAPLLLLPIVLPRDRAPPEHVPPAFWLLYLLTRTVGLPFFVVAATGPLLQRWFAGTGHPAARDPYFLYASSNLGSMLALLSYPLLLEPTLALAAQGWGWTAGYGLLLALLSACAVIVWRTPTAASEVDASSRAVQQGPLGTPRRFRWVLLAFVPSSLMLSVTTYLTTDIAAVPLLWVVPLALYLLTFTLVFARRTLLPHAFLIRWMPLVVIVLVLLLLSEATEPVGLLLGLHLLGLFWIGMVCHGEAAHDRPPPRHLTEFYLWLAIGGVLGGLFNALVAPLVFNAVTEYPLVVVLACLLRPAAGANEKRAHHAAARPGRYAVFFGGPLSFRLDIAPSLVLGGATALGVVVLQKSGLPPGPASVGLMFGLPAVVCYLLQGRQVRFGLSVAALLLAGLLYEGVHGATEYRSRSFFGVHRVTLDPTGAFRLLVHGNTVHGQQSRDPGRRREPLTYYHRTGPIGQVFAALQDDPKPRRVGVVGLGTGALAAYARPGDAWAFFEIDPAVIRIARDSGLFTFCHDSAVPPEIVQGDGRLTLARHDGRFDVLVIDAFSSDAIPVHLLTREALDTYLDHLNDDGVLAFNISNRYLDLEPVLGALARGARPKPLVCLAQRDLDLGDDERLAGKSPSHWVVMARSPKALRELIDSGRWQTVPGSEAAPWTDDFSNLVRFLKWQ